MNRLLGTGSSSKDRPNDLTVSLPLGKQHEGINRMEGYLTFKETKAKMFSSSEAWTRQYFVIEGNDMYYYRKKEVRVRNIGIYIYIYIFGSLIVKLLIDM
jgi:hypothetical protein